MQDVATVEENGEVCHSVEFKANPDYFPVASHKISDIAVLDQKKQILDLNVIQTHFFNQGLLTLNQLKKILNDGEHALAKEPNILEINRKCFIFGDIHGQFYDLVKLIENFDCRKDTLLFLGDYVDRGVFSVETYLYLILLKTHYPNNVYLLRGNHESEKMTKYFTFKAECVNKYGEAAYKSFLRSFNMLPIAAVIQNVAFCAHAGISPQIKKLSSINSFNRFKEIEYSGVICDILWSDPHEFYDLGLGLSWEYNEKRRCSYKYNYEDVKKFLDNTKLSMIIRAHEVQEEGYKLMKIYKDMPSVVTIFSAPCYCDAYQNKGAYIEFDSGITSIKQFEAVPHPYVLPGFLDGINWSLSFVTTKITEFTMALFNELDNTILEDPVQLINNMGLMRLEREAIDEFEKEDSIETCTLASIETEYATFEQCKQKDAGNEMKQEKAEEVSVSIDISPSLLPEVLEEAVDLNTSNKLDEVTIISQDGTQKIKRKERKNRNSCRFICGLFD